MTKDGEARQEAKRKTSRRIVNKVKEDMQRFGVTEGWAEMEPDYLLW